MHVKQERNYLEGRTWEIKIEAANEVKKPTRSKNDPFWVFLI